MLPQEQIRCLQQRRAGHLTSHPVAAVAVVAHDSPLQLAAAGAAAAHLATEQGTVAAAVVASWQLQALPAAPTATGLPTSWQCLAAQHKHSLLADDG
jgi:hypothetical protein